MAEVKGALKKEVLDVVRRIVSRAEGASLWVEDGQGGERLVWAGFARMTWDCSSVWALDAPSGLILAALPTSKRVEWVFRDEEGEVAWLRGTADLKAVGRVGLRVAEIPLTLVTDVEWAGVEIRSHGISVGVKTGVPRPSGAGLSVPDRF